MILSLMIFTFFSTSCGTVNEAIEKFDRIALCKAMIEGGDAREALSYARDYFKVPKHDESERVQNFLQFIEKMVTDPHWAQNYLTELNQIHSEIERLSRPEAYAPQREPKRRDKGHSTTIVVGICAAAGVAYYWYYLKKKPKSERN